MKLRVILITALLGTSLEAAEFEATGNKNKNNVAPPNKRGEVVVTFDTMPTKMSFDLPGHIKMIMENGIPYINGATETYIPAEGFHEGSSYESWNDHRNEFARMWIESANDARIVVRHRCALMKKVNGKSVIVHSDKKQVAPYGKGNWCDEWYVIHPDGSHIRRIKLWNAVAKESGSHRAQKTWPYELEGAYIWWGKSPDKTKVSDHLEDGFITLIKMNGKSKTINVNPYPLGVNEYGKMANTYGTFKDSNIQVFNTKSKYRPWRMGRPSPNCLMTPYVPVHAMTQLVPTFPANSIHNGWYSVAGLGQMDYSDFWQLEDDSMSEVWLNGFIDASADAADELSARAKSWWEAPKMSLAIRNGAKLHGHDVAENAFLLESSAARGVSLNIAASSKNPLINPMFLIGGWGKEKPTVEMDGKKLTEGNDLRVGHYETLKLQDGREWKDAMAVWIKMKSEQKVQLKFGSGKSGSSSSSKTFSAEDHPLRTWTSRSGKRIEARLVTIMGSNVQLKTKDGKTLQIRKTSLSNSDQKYLAEL